MQNLQGELVELLQHKDSFVVVSPLATPRFEPWDFNRGITPR